MSRLSDSPSVAAPQAAGMIRGVERSVLEKLSEDAPLSAVLEELVLGIEAQAEGLIGSILLVDTEGRLSHGAAPHLPEEYNQSLRDVRIGPSAGSCGTAAHTREMVIVEDIATDPLWTDYRHLALAHGLRACWSCPIVGEGGKVIGTFGFYYRQPRRPSEAEIALVRESSQLARLAIRFWRTQEALREQERVTATLLGNLPGMAYRCRQNAPWTMDFVSAGCRTLTGYDAGDLLGNRTIGYERIIEADHRASARETLDRAVARREPYELTYRIRTREGDLKWVWDRGESVGSGDGSVQHVEGFITDITDRKLLERQILQAQGLESIGTLAGGIAHDLNNIFAPIILANDLLRSRISDPASLRLLDTLGGSAHRGAALVRQILLFARGMEGRRIAVRLETLFAELADFLERTLPKSIRVTIDVPQDISPILGDPSQLHQVLLNLSVNARDAMASGGNLSLVAAPAAVSPSGPRPHPDALPGEYVRIDVSDDGSGIPEEFRNRIFDPFFTTKEVGRGTGLGLSTARAIVKSHRGFITYASSPRTGTVFSVFLPAALNAPIEETREAAPEAVPRGRGEHILIVDDEESVRVIMRTTLENFGFRVSTSGSGAEAIDLVATGCDVDLAIVDMHMPGLEGNETIAALRKLRPSLAIISASGFATNQKRAVAEARGVRHFIDKPFSVEVLLRAVQSALAEGPGPRSAGR